MEDITLISQSRVTKTFYAADSYWYFKPALVFYRLQYYGELQK